MFSQTEADFFIKEPKQFIDNPSVIIKSGKSAYTLVGVSSGAMYNLSVYRGKINILKISLSKMIKKTQMLLRVDVNGTYHTNPDGAVIGKNHIHIYKEGHSTSWAQEIDELVFCNIQEPQTLFDDFCKYCNIDITSCTVQVEM